MHPTLASPLRSLAGGIAALTFAASLPLAAQQAHGTPWIVPAIFSPGAAAGGGPPGDGAWSPDGARYSYLTEEEGLLSLDAATGRRTVLVAPAELAAAKAREVGEKDRDHRARYNQASYLWSPDSRRVLLDLDGTLWLKPVGGGSATQVGDTGQGSGDDPKFSPDGRTLSYIHDHNLYALTPGSAPVALTVTRDPALLNGEVDWVYLEELKVRSNYAWAPDSAHLVYLQMNETAVPQYPIEDWIPTHATLDVQRYPQPGDRNPAVRVGVVAAVGGATRWIDLPVRPGDDYIPRLGWVDAHTVWVETLARDHQHRALFFGDVETGAVREVFREEDPKFLTDLYDITFYGRGHFLLTSWRDGHLHLYQYSFSPAHPLAAEAQEERELEHGDYDVHEVLSVDEAAGRVFYAGTETAGGQGQAVEEQVWSIALDGSRKQPVSRTPGWHHATFAEGHGSYADLASSATTPPTLTLCPAQGECRQMWQAKRDTAHADNPAIPLTLKAADGTTVLYATLTLPQGASANAAVPLINNPYGGPGTATVVNRWAGAQHNFDALLAEHGFAVLHVDNRGMAGRGRDFEQAAFRDFGKVQLADQLAAIDQVLARYPQLDAHRLGWWGWSWGGTFTLNALTHSDRFRAGVSVAPVTDMRNYDSIYTERYLGLPAENAAAYDRAAVLGDASRLHGHLLLVHGTGDDNVHIENTVQFVRKLIEAGEPYDLQLYPRKTHSIAGPEARTHLYTRILGQFKTYLKPEPPAR